MKLIPISEHPDHAKILWDLLAERTPEQSISHKGMPTWEEHLAFVERMAPIPATEFGSDVYYAEIRFGEPRYQDWYLVEVDGAVVASIYLSGCRNEIGVSVFREFRGRGHGSEAVRLITQKFGPAKYLANINPANEPSRKMFEKLGFKKIQETYALDAD